MAFFIIVSLIVFLIMDFKISIDLSYDIYKNMGLLKLRIFGIPIFSVEISLIGESFHLVKKDKKVIQIKILDINRETIKLFEDISAGFIKKINLSSLALRCNLSGESPYHISLASGIISSIFGVVLTKVQASYPYSVLNNSVNTKFIGDELYLQFSGKIVINLYDLVWAISRAIYIRRYKNYGKERYMYKGREC